MDVAFNREDEEPAVPVEPDPDLDEDGNLILHTYVSLLNESALSAVSIIHSTSIVMLAATRW